MFDKLIKELKKLERGVQIPVDVPLDEEQYFDRKCPQTECQTEFKVLFEDWKAKVSDERVYCPICRCEAPSSHWNMEEQSKYHIQKAAAHVQEIIDKAVKEDVRAFNSRQRSGFITLSMSYRPGSRSILVPIDAAKSMHQKFTCEACGCHYAAIGAAFFCPACGHNSVVVTFELTLKNVRQVVSDITSIRNAISSQLDNDTAENSCRLILENGLEKLVGAFQHFAGALFMHLPNSGNFNIRKNLFQNLPASSHIWRDATGKGYEDFLTAGEVVELNCLFQKRHLIAHRNGIVDQEYIDKSGDRTYAIGQRLVIQESNVLRLAELISKLGTQLQQLK